MMQTILIVDDDANARAGLRRSLGPGYKVLEANDACEGLECVKKGDIDVVVSDERMPGPWGTEFLAQVRHVAPYTVRILLTGAFDVETASAAINHGGIFHVLTKPCDPALFRSTVAQAMESRRRLLEVAELLNNARYDAAVLHHLARNYPALVRDAKQQVRSAMSGSGTPPPPRPTDIVRLVGHLTATDAVMDIQPEPKPRNGDRTRSR